MDRGFKFTLGTNVSIAGGSEVGRIVARAEYENSENTYYLRYVAGDGRAVEEWWGESALELKG